MTVACHNLRVDIEFRIRIVVSCINVRAEARIIGPDEFNVSVVEAGVYVDDGDAVTSQALAGGNLFALFLTEALSRRV